MIVCVMLDLLKRQKIQSRLTAELSTVRCEPKIGDLRKSNIVHIKARDPLVLILVLQFELEVVLLEVCKLSFSRNYCAAQTPSRASSQLLILSVICMVVRCLAIACKR